MKSDSKKDISWQGGSAFRGSIDFTPMFQRLCGIESELWRLIVDDGKRQAEIPEYIITGDDEKRENIAGQSTITIEELSHGLPKEIQSYYSESIEKLNELGKTFQSKCEEEKVLCKKLTEFKQTTVYTEVDEGTKTTNLIIGSPIKDFLKKYHADIINMRKQYVVNHKPLKEKVYLENEKEYAVKYKYNTVEDFVCLNESQKLLLRDLLKFFEDGAIKYPRLIHVVLEWPILTLMPKPPKSLLDYCKPEEYEYMLKRRKGNFIRDSNFSTPEISSTTWLIYPKSESWSKESGIKRFNDLAHDISCELGCNWEVLLHCYGLTMSYGHHLFDDGWDGLFDEDCYFSEEGFRNGFYNCYYITDVFYESIRLCRKLLESESITKNKNGDTTKKYLEILHHSAERASIEEIRIMYEVVEFLWIWISRDVPKNKSDFIKAWADLCATTNDRMTKITIWLKWNKSELAKDIEREYSEFINFVEQEISDSPVCKDLTTSFTMARGAAINLAEKLKHVAELAKTLKIAGQENESMGTQPELTDTEQNIIEALGKKTLIGEKLAKKAGYPYNSNFKSTLSSLRKRGILGNKSPGYFVQPKYHFLISKSDQGQD